MPVSASVAWKLALTVALLTAIFVSARARAPRRSLAGAELQRLVLAALGLYAVGTIAWLTHHVMVAVLVYAAGIATAALGAWLSRGDDSEEPPGGSDPFGEHPPDDPEGPLVDWAAFQRDLRDYSERIRPAAGAR